MVKKSLKRTTNSRFFGIMFSEYLFGGWFMENKKVLFVIPAHNEEKNIKNVIKDIKINVPYADIIVINDWSTDKTKDLVEKEDVILLNMPFNVGYAPAVQTGIKYAYEKDYDYVMQFDGDGQHIALEAEKILNKAIETNADIVVGSRFLKKTKYKHPLFRRIGTKIFSILIKMFCKKEITDPTSGFQCLNKKVIKRYSKMQGYPEFPDANLIIEMLLNGYKIEEESVIMKENNTGVSMHSGIYKPFKYMVKMIYTIAFILLKHLLYGEGNNK